MTQLKPMRSFINQLIKTKVLDIAEKLLPVLFISVENSLFYLDFSYDGEIDTMKTTTDWNRFWFFFLFEVNRMELQQDTRKQAYSISLSDTLKPLNLYTTCCFFPLDCDKKEPEKWSISTFVKRLFFALNTHSPYWHDINRTNLNLGVRFYVSSLSPSPLSLCNYLYFCMALYLYMSLLSLYL